MPNAAVKDVRRVRVCVCVGFRGEIYCHVDQNCGQKPVSFSRSRITDAVMTVASVRDSQPETWRSDRAQRKDSWTFRAVDTCTRKANVSTAVDRSIGWAQWLRMTTFCDWSRFTRSSLSGDWACVATVWNPSDRT